jgi:hypothetical protein
MLKSSKSSHLTVEQPTKFEFFINLKTAKTRGVTIPRNLLTLASEVIELNGASIVTSDSSDSLQSHLDGRHVE